MIRSLYSLPDCSLLTWSNSILKENIIEKKKKKKSHTVLFPWSPYERLDAL